MRVSIKRTLFTTLLMMFSVLACPADWILASEPLPGEKANYVIAIGYLKADPSLTNHVRLGTYRFSAATGSVKGSMYYWTQENPVGREGTRTIPSGNCTGEPTRVRACEVLTVRGFVGPPNWTRTGTYRMYTVASGTYVHISWGPNWSEEWWVRSSSDGRYSILDFKYSNRATRGYGYGSNASFTKRRAMSTVRAITAPLKHHSETWTRDREHPGMFKVTPKTFTWDMSVYRHCTSTTWCLTWLQQNQGVCVGCSGSAQSSIQTLIQKMSSFDRRDTLWHWCTCLVNYPNCPKLEGNSHVRPMMQIIDDSGEFRGWVGVEASFYKHTDKDDPRHHDMIGVFHIYESS